MTYCEKRRKNGENDRDTLTLKKIMQRIEEEGKLKEDFEDSYAFEPHRRIGYQRITKRGDFETCSDQEEEEEKEKKKKLEI
jgi:hypothetical protein